MSGTTIIDVTFVDADTGKEFLKLKMPLRQLPEVQSTMSLGNDAWFVFKLSPSSVEEILEQRKVSLVLRKVQTIDPATILFSLPTVADVTPVAVIEGGSLTDALRLQEDDWLQLELVPADRLGRAQRDFDAILNILRSEREGAGFKRLHLRKPMTAFEGRDLTLEQLAGLFGEARPVAWVDGTAPLEHCFAFTLPGGASLYGQAPGGTVSSLGLTARDQGAMQRLGGLMLIDWCRASVDSADGLLRMT